MRRELFSGAARPLCRHCARGRFSNDGKMILCLRRGVVDPDSSCKKFRYDPLKRVPVRLPKLPDYGKDEFSL